MLRVTRRAQDEHGFTLIELLVVILIIGILAAIAIPSFISQRGKANDAAAKSDVRAAQTAAETKFTEDYTYANVSLATLRAIEPTLTGSTLSAASGDADRYALSGRSTSATPVTFTINRVAGGAITRSCTPASTGGCPANGSW